MAARAQNQPTTGLLVHEAMLGAVWFSTTCRSTLIDRPVRCGSDGCACDTVWRWATASSSIRLAHSWAIAVRSRRIATGSINIGTSLITSTSTNSREAWDPYLLCAVRRTGRVHVKINCPKLRSLAHRAARFILAKLSNIRHLRPGFAKRSTVKSGHTHFSTRHVAAQPFLVMSCARPAVTFIAVRMKRALRELIALSITEVISSDYFSPFCAFLYTGRR